MTKLFEHRLAPFAKKYATLIYEMRLELEQADDAELKKLRSATRSPTKTNCEWSVYEVAPIVQKEVRRILTRRARVRAAARERERQERKNQQRRDADA